MIKEQHITDNYALYCSDCMLVLPSIADASIDLSVYSPPFAGLYNYSSHENDFSNCESKQQFLEQYEFLVAETSRVTKPGCISAVHVQDIIGKDGDMWDFPHEVKVLHQKYGFAHRNTVTIWKEPLKVRLRTMIDSLKHQFIVEDSSKCFTAMPDYLLIFKKKGEREAPVTHPNGLTHYAGETPFLQAHIDTYGDYETFRKKWLQYDGDPKGNKLSHLTWQRYASSVWDDIRIDNVLPFKDARDEDDEKHVHPLQLDVIDRIVELYTNPGEVVLTPFMGVGSEVFSPVSMGRNAIGIELKDSYFKQAVLNCKEAEKRFTEGRPKELFDEVEKVALLD